MFYRIACRLPALLLCLAAVPAPLQAEPAQLDAGMVNPGYQEQPAWFANSFLDIREDVREAAADDRRVLLYFYQDGCPYCKKLLNTNFALKETETRVRESFSVIAINMWGDREVTGLDGEQTTEKAFAKSLRVMFTPTLLFLDEGGRVVLRVNGYYPPHKFNAAMEYGSMNDGVEPDFRTWYTALSPRPSRGVLHRQHATLPPDSDLAARPGGRPLLVMFEQKDCAPCDELHLDILERPESRAQLARFDVVVLDMWSEDPVRRPDGVTGSEADWARELKVQYAPSLLFFDAAGKEVFRTEAWLRSFHIQSVMDYVASGAYREQPSFQRFIAARADALEAQGVHVDLLD